MTTDHDRAGRAMGTGLKRLSIVSAAMVTLGVFLFGLWDSIKHGNVVVNNGRIDWVVLLGILIVPPLLFFATLGTIRLTIWTVNWVWSGFDRDKAK